MCFDSEKVHNQANMCFDSEKVHEYYLSAYLLVCLSGRKRYYSSKFFDSSTYQRAFLIVA